MNDQSNIPRFAMIQVTIAVLAVAVTVFLVFEVSSLIERRDQLEAEITDATSTKLALENDIAEARAELDQLKRKAEDFQSTIDTLSPALIRCREETDIVEYVAGDLPGIRPEVQQAQAAASASFEVVQRRAYGDKLRPLRLVTKGFGEGDNEFIDLRALAPVDLRGGSLGDSKRPPGSPESVALGSDSNLDLGRDDVIRIFIGKEFIREPGMKSVALGHHKGIWKGDRGESDRIWVADKDGNVLLDFDYSILSAN
jgi:hypothetical protein